MSFKTTEQSKEIGEFSADAQKKFRAGIKVQALDSEGQSVSDIKAWQDKLV